MATKFSLVSDVHVDLNQGYIPVEIASTQKNYGLVIAGDLGEFRSPTTKAALKKFSEVYNWVVYTSGNHEFYGSEKTVADTERDIIQFCTQFNNVHYLSVYTPTVEVGNTRFVGCTGWTPSVNEKLSNDFNNIRGMNIASRNMMYTVSMSYIQNEIIGFATNNSTARNLVIVTHTAPVFSMKYYDYFKKAESGELADYYMNKYDIRNTIDLIESIPRQKRIVWCFGHTHLTVDAKKHGVRFVNNPVGYLSDDTRNSFLKFKDKIIEL